MAGTAIGSNPSAGSASPSPDPVNPQTATAAGPGNQSFADTVVGVKQANSPAPSQRGSSGSPSTRTGGASTTQSSGGSKSDYSSAINPLKNGDSVAVSLQLGAKVTVPLEEVDVPASGGPQGQYGYGATVTRVDTKDGVNYNVSFDKNLMAGVITEEPLPIKPQAEANLIHSSTVTLTFHSKADLLRGLSALRQTAQAQTARDAGTVAKIGTLNPSVPRQDLDALNRDVRGYESDVTGYLSNLFSGVGALAAGQPGVALSDAAAAGGDVALAALHAGKAARDAGKTAYDAAGDFATKVSNLSRNPLDQLPTDPATVPLNPLAATGLLALAGPLPAAATYLANAAEDYASKLGPSAADAQFLKDHITGYSATIGVQGRGSVELKGVGGATRQPRLAGALQVTVAETKPDGNKPGTVSITETAKLNADLKSSLSREIKGDGGKGKGSLSDIANLGSGTVSATSTYELSAEQSRKLETAGHSLPITDLIPADRLDHPDQVTTKLDLQSQLLQPTIPVKGGGPLLTDVSWTRTSTSPGEARDLLNSFNDNPISASLDHATRTEDTYEVSGRTYQVEVGGEIKGLASAKASVQEQELSLHRVSHDGPSPPQPTPAFRTPGPAVHQSPASQSDQQLVVLPDAGLNIRRSPNADAGRVGAFTGGTFVQTAGQRAVDAQGNHWVRVSGFDSNRKTVTGWVEAQYVTPHADGGENTAGRIERSPRDAGYLPITVQPGDTVDGIAARYGRDPAQSVAVNRGHVINPDQIFPGDTVYLAQARPVPTA